MSKPHIKYTVTETAVSGDVFAVVHQSTVPVRPIPQVLAPVAILTVLPELPNVRVEPHLTSTSFTSILLIIL